MSSFIPGLGPLGNFQQDDELSNNPIAALIMSQRRREAEEEKRRRLEEQQKAYEQARAQAEQVKQLQNEANASGFPGVAEAERQRMPQQPPQQDPLAQVNQRLATQYQTPEDMRTSYERRMWGMKEGQEKPTFGQRASTLLAEMVRGMAQGSKYKNIAERAQEMTEKDYQLSSSRMAQLNAAEKIQALTEKSQAYEAQRAFEFAQKQQLEQQKLQHKQSIDYLKTLSVDKNLTERERHNKQLEVFQSQKIKITPENFAAAEAGIIKDVVEENGIKSFTYDLSDADKRKKFLDALKKYEDATADNKDRTILTKNQIKIDTVDELGRKISKIVPIEKVTQVIHGKGGVLPTAPESTTIPDVPAPSREPRLPSNNPLSRAQTLQGIQLEFPNFTPDEHKALEGSRRTLVDINRSLSAANKEFRTWAEGGKKNDKGIGEFMQGTDVTIPGLGPVDATRWAKASAPGQWLQRTFSSASDTKQQEKQARLDRIMKAYKEAQAAAMFGDGGKTLTATEKQLTKDYWSEPTEGPVAFYRGLLTTQAMVKLNEERLMRRVTPSEEQSLSSDIADYVNSTVLKLADSPKKVKDSDLDANVFLPRLMAKREALTKSAPSANTPQPPVVKKEEKPDPTKTKSVLEYERRIKEEQEKKGITTRGGSRIRRVN